MKCPNCGNEINGKFCTKCGTPAPAQEAAPAPTNPVCPTCGEEVKGKFCTKCGTPMNAPAAPVQEAPVQEAPQPMQYNPAPQANEQNNVTPEPVQYGQQYNNAQPNDGYTGQQFTNQPTGGYTGQQFTNQPKAKKSNGKVIGIIIAVVAALFLIICAIVGIVIYNIVDSVKDEVSKIESSSKVINIIEETTEPKTEPETTEPETTIEETTTKEGYDPKSRLEYIEVSPDAVHITGYEPDYDFKGSTLEVKIPSEIDGKKVENIDFLGVYESSYNQDVYIKVIIPGSIEELNSYSISFNRDIDEVVIEDGVKKLNENAFIGCSDLVKVTVPESVKMMDGCGLGFDVDEDDYSIDVPIKGFEMSGKKGSTAEKYCKDNKFTFKEVK